MSLLCELNAEQLKAFHSEAIREYNAFLDSGISINMARGRPAPEQLDISNALIDLSVQEMGVKAEDGTDCRNYGLLCGIPECRRLFGEMMGVAAENVIVGGSSSLNLMYDYIAQCCSHGTCGNTPWSKLNGCKFIAVVPGYDRHFAIAEHFGLEMVSVKMTPQGPDMDAVEALVKDPAVKGMFCVPKYSNPDGITYSPQTVERIAAMKTAAPDFRVIWDEAYVMHDLYEEKDVLANVFELAQRYGTEDRFFIVASTSKISFAGAGLAALAASEKNIKEIRARLALQVICYDKINQLRHARLFASLEDIRVQMKKHAALLRPKFDAVLSVLHEQLDGLGIASFNSPKGGYFISLDVNTGSAKRVGQLCKDCGLVLTGVGATFPYGIDPEDANIRIAPSCPSVSELNVAARILCASVKIAACEALLQSACCGR